MIYIVILWQIVLCMLLSLQNRLQEHYYGVILEDIVLPWSSLLCFRTEKKNFIVVGHTEYFTVSTKADHSIDIVMFL